MAADKELLKQMAVVDAECIYRESAKAFQALHTLLGDDDYFFGAYQPGLFDASVFAYTSMLFGKAVSQLRNTKMMEGVREFDNLRAHWDRIMAGYFPGNRS